MGQNGASPKSLKSHNEVQNEGMNCGNVRYVGGAKPSCVKSLKDLML